MLSPLTPHEANIKKWLIPVTRSEIDKRLNNNPKLRRFMTRLAILLRTSFLILTLICASQTMARSQKYKVTIKVKEQKLLDVFKSIQQQTNLIVFYSNTILNDQEKVSIQVKDEPLEKVLDQIIAGKALKYEVQEKYIVIAPKEEKKGGREIKEGMSAEDFASLPPPEIDVVVRVTDEEGNPLVGASVMIRGTKTGTQTNEAGIASLKGVADNAVLEVSFVGYENEVVSVSKRNAIVLELKKKENELQEVIVGKGYYEEKQRYTVGNTVRISGKDIEKQPVTNPLLALQGRVPGLFITQNTGFANGAFKVRIQGQNSIINDNNPLIVVDGIPLSFELPIDGTTLSGPLATSALDRGNNPIAFIDPMNIESIDILKDADATAIYGSRAANGAILITTKKSKPGKIKVNVGVQQGWSKVPRKLDLLNTRQYLDMRYEALKNDGLGIGTSAAFNDLRLWDTTRYTDWQEELIGGTAGYTNANVSITGGSNTAQYLIGGSYNRTTTVFPGDFSNKRGGLHFNINAASTNQKLKISLSGSFMIGKNGMPYTDLTSEALTLVPIAPSLFNADGSLNWAPNQAGSSTWTNPLVNTYYRDYEHESKLLTTSGQISYLVLPGFTLKSNFGYNNTQVNSFSSQRIEATRPESRLNTARTSSFNNSSLGSVLIEPQASYSKQLTNNLVLDALAGGTIQKNLSEANFIRASGFISDLLLKDIGSATSVTASKFNSIYRYAALFGRINFNLNKKYILNVTARRDGSSRFGSDNLFNNFWSVGGGWIFSDENGIHKALSSFLSFGKLRLSYGTTGGDGIGDYQFQNSFDASTAGIPYQGAIGLLSTGINNPFIQWEETRKLQGGVDLGFFKDRLMVNATYVRNRSSNQLIRYSLPTITGVTSVPQNLPALVQNTSLEIAVSAIALKTKDFTWQSNFNLTLPKNKVVAFPGIENTSYASGMNGIIIGQPIGSTYFAHHLGVDPLLGYYYFDDGKGNAAFNPTAPESRYILRAFQPRFYGGWGNSFEFKGLVIDFLFQFVSQLSKVPSVFVDANGSLTPGRFSNGNGNQSTAVLNRWQKAGDRAQVARYSTTGGQTVIMQSDAAISEDGSFSRLKNVSVSWQLPKNLTNYLHVQNVSMFFRGQNLFTITNYTGLDPESQGTALPPLRTWTFGFNLSF